MSQIASFDVFDTCLTRTFANPRDLFLELGARLFEALEPGASAEEFQRVRMRAEKNARKRCIGKEVTFAEIYMELSRVSGWPNAVIAKAMELELELEQTSLRPVPGALSRLRQLRAANPQVLFLCDSYLPSDFIRDCLIEHGFFQKGDTIYVSCELRKSKRRGSLYRMVRGRYPEESWQHYGDDPRSDVFVPRLFKIRPKLLAEGRLTRYESRMRGRGTSVALWRSRLAAAMRLARTGDSPPGNDREATLRATGADIAGPLFFGFVYWCLEEAEKRGIERLYFVSQGGQLWSWIAARIAKAWGYKVQCSYLYGSTQAWNPATLKKEETRRVIRYLWQEKWFNGSKAGLVNMGGRDGLQSSLQQTLRAAGMGPNPKVAGFYYGLLPEALDADSQRLGYLNTFAPAEARSLALHFSVLQSFAAADHGPVQGYTEVDGAIHPVLSEMENTEALSWGLKLLQNSALAFTDCALRVCSRGSFSPGDYFKASQRVYRLFHDHPEQAEAALWSGFPVPDQNAETQGGKPVASWRLALALARGKVSPSAIWFQGKLSLEPDLFLTAAYCICALWLRHSPARERRSKKNNALLLTSSSPIVLTGRDKHEVPL